MGSGFQYAEDTKGNANKRKIVHGWILDPQFQDGFYGSISGINTTESIGRKSEWMSKKEVLDKYDESEAEEMVEAGTLNRRRNPKNLKRWQYLFVKDHHTQKIEKFDTRRTEGQLKLKGEDFARTQRALTGFNMGESMLGWKNHNEILSVGLTGLDDASESEEEEEESGASDDEDHPMRHGPRCSSAGAAGSGLRSKSAGSGLRSKSAKAAKPPKAAKAAKGTKEAKVEKAEHSSEKDAYLEIKNALPKMATTISSLNELLMTTKANKTGASKDAKKQLAKVILELEAVDSDLKDADSKRNYALKFLNKRISHCRELMSKAKKVEKNAHWTVEVELGT